MHRGGVTRTVTQRGQSRFRLDAIGQANSIIPKD